MNLSALPELLLAWVKNQGNAMFKADGQERGNPLFRTGQVYEGRILDQMANGRFLVQVAGQKLDMALPRGNQPGEGLRLTYLGGGPRPTFLLNQTAPVQQPSAAQPVSLSSTAQQAQALARLAGPAPSSTAGLTGSLAPAATPTVSPSGQGALSSAPALATGKPATTAMALQTLATGPSPAEPAPAASTRVPASLAAGQAPAPGGAVNAAALGRPIVANVVMLQAYGLPQAVVPPAGVSPNTALVGQMVEGLRAAIPSSTTLTPNVLAEMPEPSPEQLPARLSQTLSESGLFYEAHLRRWARGELSFENLLREPQARLVREPQASGGSLAELGGMPDEAARLAGRQVQLLEGAPFLWQGLAWPGQWMEWLVEERPGGDGQEGGEGEGEGGRWRTELRLTLPRLGPIHARIELHGNTLKLDLNTRDEAVRQELRAALPSLVEGLVGAGLRLSSLNVEADLAG